VQADNDQVAVSVTAAVGLTKPSFLVNLAGSFTAGINSTLTEAYIGTRGDAGGVILTDITARLLSGGVPDDDGIL
jgi:hypothetical protein